MKNGKQNHRNWHRCGILWLSHFHKICFLLCSGERKIETQISNFKRGKSVLSIFQLFVLFGVCQEKEQSDRKSKEKSQKLQKVRILNFL